jgi:hypothetical protein
VIALGVFCGIVALMAGAAGLGYSVGRGHARVKYAYTPMPATAPREPTYREPAENDKPFFGFGEGDPRRTSNDVLRESRSKPAPAGPFVITPGPELFKTSCSRCGSRFAYRLADTRKPLPGSIYPRVSCPACGHEELHST